jgi:hypothetical protein
MQALDMAKDQVAAMTSSEDDPILRIQSERLKDQWKQWLFPVPKGPIDIVEKAFSSQDASPQDFVRILLGMPKLKEGTAAAMFKAAVPPEAARNAISSVLPSGQTP